MSRPVVRRDRLAQLLERLVAAYGPSGHEEPALRVLRDACAAAGLAYEDRPVPRGSDERTNIVVSLGPRDDRAIVLVGHVDTIPVRPDESPRPPRWDGDILHGLGAADMLGGCAAMIEAFIALGEGGVALARGAEIALLVGEEDEGDGARAAMETFSAPVVVVGEPTNLVPCTSHYGYVELRLETVGRRAHAAVPEVGANAVLAMARWIAKLVAALDPALHVASVREIRGGMELFVVADRCEAIVDVHVAPGEDVGLVEHVLALGESELGGGGCTASVVETIAEPGRALHHDSPIVKLLERTFRRVGRPFEPRPFRSHSDANLLGTEGVIPIVLGPGSLEVAHTLDEHVDFNEVVEAAALYAALVIEACVDRSSLVPGPAAD